MAVAKRRLELNCIICSHPLTSIVNCLPEDVLQMVTDLNVNTSSVRRRKYAADPNNSYMDIDQQQVMGTKCGHMFHLGCLRGHIKNFMERSGTAPCPLCSKPVSLARLWPILIPPTPAQVSRLKKMNAMQKENGELKVELKEIKRKIKSYEADLAEVGKETEACLADILVKQQNIKGLNGPTEAELEELRDIYRKRQAIVRVVTKHNADLLGVLMHETTVQMSAEDQECSEVELKHKPYIHEKERRVYGSPKGLVKYDDDIKHRKHWDRRRYACLSASGSGSETLLVTPPVVMESSQTYSEVSQPSSYLQRNRTKIHKNRNNNHSKGNRKFPAAIATLNANPNPYRNNRAPVPLKTKTLTLGRPAIEKTMGRMSNHNTRVPHHQPQFPRAIIGGKILTRKMGTKCMVDRVGHGHHGHPGIGEDDEYSIDQYQRDGGGSFEDSSGSGWIEGQNNPYKDGNNNPYRPNNNSITTNNNNKVRFRPRWS